jgi:hypothetical protein
LKKRGSLDANMHPWLERESFNANMLQPISTQLRKGEASMPTASLAGEGKLQCQHAATHQHSAEKRGSLDANCILG